MVNLAPTQLRYYSDDHLLTVCNLSTNLSDLEQELIRRLEPFVDKGNYDQGYSDCEKSNESALEQSEFRKVLINEILGLLDNKYPRYKETKELIKEIQDMVENSYVEL